MHLSLCLSRASAILPLGLRRSTKEIIDLMQLNEVSPPFHCINFQMVESKQVRSVTIRKKPSEYGSWSASLSLSLSLSLSPSLTVCVRRSLVSFESEAAAERALNDTDGVYTLH